MTKQLNEEIMELVQEKLDAVGQSSDKSKTASVDILLEALDGCLTASNLIIRSFGSSRETSLALTKLDECMLWMGPVANVYQMKLNEQAEKEAE